MRVLLCDDVDDMRFMLRMSLGRDLGFEVVGEASDGAEAVQQARRLNPDLVLLDLAMPVMGGLEALPRIREAAPDCRVIVLSSFEEATAGPEVLALGAAAYIQKGTRITDIVGTIKRVVKSLRPPT